MIISSQYFQLLSSCFLLKKKNKYDTIHLSVDYSAKFMKNLYFLNNYNNCVYMVICAYSLQREDIIFYVPSFFVFLI